MIEEKVVVVPTKPVTTEFLNSNDGEDLHDDSVFPGIGKDRILSLQRNLENSRRKPGTAASIVLQSFSDHVPAIEGDIGALPVVKVDASMDVLPMANADFVQFPLSLLRCNLRPRKIV